MMRISQLLESVANAQLRGSIDLDVTSIELDSRRVRPGSMFVALPGARRDGRQFVTQAIERGAVAVLAGSERPAGLADSVAWVSAGDPRRALAQIARCLAGAPDDQLAVIGVTGTKGKTTTTSLLAAGLSRAGMPTAQGGTLGQRFGAQHWPTNLTTPEAPQLWEFLARSLELGARSAVIEVSSVALEAQRCAGIRFRAAILTGLGHDHLDLHRTPANYRRAKRLLFEMLDPSAVAVIPAGEEYTAEFRAAAAARVVTFGIGSAADWRVQQFQAQGSEASFVIVGPGFERVFRWRRPGAWDALNLAAALAAASFLGVELERVAQGAEQVDRIEGRFEWVDVGQPYLAIVDYAHTPESLENIVSTLRRLVAGRVICVFGCGGERDRSKRALMGQAAAKHADFVIVTDDNPRSEDPARIAAEVLEGTRGLAAQAEWITPRRLAIQRAVELARAGDVVLVAGKGHETYQEIGDSRIPFDDRQVLREAIQASRGQA
jgi:UDP-N-acetylmuramoyl-L-alanyl-D-glutamate--2,6-diaminopimelate ligase